MNKAIKEDEMGEIQIRLITAADFPNFEYRYMDWDVVVNGKPYQVIIIILKKCL